MASTWYPALMYQAAPGTVAAVVYTNPLSVAKVREVVIANTTGGAASVTLNRVPKGGSASVSNQIVPGTSIPANTIVVISLDTVLLPGDFLSAVQSNANAITLTISGETLTT